VAYNTRDYWVFGLRPSSGILKNTKEHNASETGSVSVVSERWETTTLLVVLEIANFNLWIGQDYEQSPESY
jgi:hypothetical protein